MEENTEFDKFIKEMQKRGTQVIGADICMCADCVARRKTGDIRKPRIIPKESDDPIQEANRKIMLKKVKAAMIRTNQTQRKRKNNNKKKKEE